MLLFPFQFFPPGSLQIADAAMILAICTLFMGSFKIENYLKTLFYFVGYALVAGLLWMLVYSDVYFIKQPMNYMYCFFSLVFVAQIATIHYFKYATLLSLFISLLMQLFALNSVGFNDEQFRFILYFNNPNQLGLWALTILFYFAGEIVKNPTGKFNRFIVVSSIIVSSIFILVSISQAAIISGSIILLIILFYYIRLKPVAYVKDHEMFWMEFER